MASREEVLAALALTPGPDGRTPLPEFGAITGLTMRDGKVFLAIAVDPAQAQKLEPMRAAAEAAIKKAPGVTSAVVTLTAEAAREATAPAGPQPHAHARHAARAAGQPIPGVKRIVAVASGKGGVGKSTVAVQSRRRPRPARAGTSACSTPTSTAPRCRGCSALPESRTSRPTGRS